MAATARRLAFLTVTGMFLLSATRCDAQIFHKKKRVNKSTSAENTAEPDKVLYNRAIDDIKHGRHQVGRLNLQTLINTYPDSEYLAKAKLSISDSFYKEGGSANMTQAIQGYKDFIVFFPFLPEASYAQLQVAMAHYRQMEKPDRDRTEARAAEDEYQIFLQKYPNDPLAAKAQQNLRDVQELLAEGDFRVGSFYFVKGNKKAAESRLRSVANRYPLYSKSDRVLWMLGDIWESTEKKEFASGYYARIVRNYPLSPLVPQAKNRLKSLGVPIPQPDPKAVAWMTAEQNAPRPHQSFMKKPLTLVHSGPGDELRSAARIGNPTMTPESETEAGTDILAGGNQSQIGGGGTRTGIVATVTPGSNSGTTSAAESTAPATEGSAPNAGSAADPNAPAATSDGASGATGTGTSDAAPKTDAAAAGAEQTSDAAKANSVAAQDGSQTGGNGDKKKESTSKKKKGLRKIIPW